MECEHENCKRKATTSNTMYFKNKWYCTFHSNRLIKILRIERKLLKKNMIKNEPHYKN